MKNIPTVLLTLALFVFGSLGISAQDLGGYKAKNDGWLVLIDEAFAESQKSGKPIMANFTGSDWCGWCKRLDKSVFHHQEFKDWANKNVVLLELDFPRRFQVPQYIKEQNANLQRAFQVRGFPSIWVFDMDQDENGQFVVNALGKTGYTKTVAEFTTNVEKMMEKREKSE